MGLTSAVASQISSILLGRSAYQRPPIAGYDLDSPEVEQLRRDLGGQLSIPSYTQTRWFLSDLEAAEISADAGILAGAARLMRAARKDGIVSGVLSTRTGGLVRLPKKFRGDAELIKQLEVGHNSVRSVFDEMFPSTELALLAADGLLLGVGVGELVPVEGRDFPVFVRLDPEFLVYRWNENRWYYQSAVGFLPITPGDGRWILHCPGGRIAPWQHGIWRAVGQAYIRKQHASLHKDAWEAKLANPARVAYAPQGSTEAQKQSMFRKVMAWGVNTVFGLTPGYEVKLLESNGRGYESFEQTIKDQNEEIKISIAGQTVTVDGGAGFQNSDVHKTIRADLIQETAEGLAYTVNTQGIPVYAISVVGLENALTRMVIVEWDVTPPKDRNSEAQSMVTVASAIKTLTEALAAHGLQLNAPVLCSRYSVPIVGDTDGDGIADSGGLVDAPSAQQQPARPQLSVVVDNENEDDLDDYDDEDELDEAAA